MIHRRVIFLCILFLRASAENVETRIHQLVIPEGSLKAEFGTSMESIEFDQTLAIGAPQKGRLYMCDYRSSALTTPTPRQCSSYVTYGAENSTVGTSMAKLKTKNDYLVVCGNQYLFSCPDLQIQQRMIGECYSYDLSTRERSLLFTPCPVTCPQGLIADLVFVIDASGSVGLDNFITGLKWIVTVLRTFSYDVDQGNLQVGYVIFNGRPYNTQAPRARSFYDLQDNITSADYRKGGTQTHLAIAAAKNLLVNARNGVPKVMITVTDGLSNSPSSTVEAAADARLEEMVMIAVGVGGGISMDELRNIATGNINDPTRVMTVSSYDNLGEILDQLSQVIKETAVIDIEGQESNSSTELTNCQFGTSVAADKNGVYVGASGSYDRSGTVAEFTNLDRFPRESATGHLNATELATILGTTTKELEDAYFGYSVTTGSFRNDLKTWIATGAPRYLSRGLVLIYQVDDKTTHTILKSSEASGHWQLGGYYGHTVLAMDINNDNYDDLLVSEPLYSQIAGYDEGIVFVYMNDRSTLSVSNWANPGYTPVILQGNSIAGSRFGMSMVNGGDIDRNGYDDVIVGAPAEKQLATDSGSGAIYIYFSSSSGLNPSRVQRIEGKTISSGLSSFGWAMQGGSDFDSNGYPDIAVSAPSSDSVVLLRSRKLIVVTLRVNVNSSIIDLMQCAGDLTVACSTVTTCLSAQYEHGSDGETFAMVQNITLDSLIGDSIHRRFYFLDTKSNKRSEAPVNVGPVATCRRYKIQLNVDSLGKVNGGGIGVVPQVEFSADLALAHKNQIMSGVLSPLSSNRETADWTFSKGCGGSSGRCEHDLVLTATYSEPMSPSPIVLNGQSKQLSVHCIVENKGADHAYFLKVNISSGNLTVNRMISSCMALADDESDPASGYTVITYQTGSSAFKDLMLSGDKCEFTLEFDFTKLQSLANEAQLRVSGKVYSNAGGDGDEIEFDPDNSNNEFTYYRTLQYQSRTMLGGNSVPESVFIEVPDDKSVTTVRTLEDTVLGGNVANFYHRYSIYNNGPLGLANARMRIAWPEFSGNGYNLLYLVDVRCEPDGACACGKKGKTNNLRIAPNEASIRDYYQEVTLKYPKDGEAFASSEKVTCETSVCTEIFCDLGNIDKFEQVNVLAFFKPWVPTFAKDFIKVEIFTSFKLIPSNLTLQPGNTDATVGSTIVSFDPENPPPPPPTNAPNIGAIIGGIVAGLILLAIAIVVMWKTGFFQSKYGTMTREARQSVRAQNPNDAEGDYEPVQGDSHAVDPQQAFKSTENLCEE